MRNLSRLILIALCHASTAFAADTGLSDPTRPSDQSGQSERAAAHASNDEKLSLTLIRLGTSPLAVINGENVHLGATIAGYKLISLQPASATLIGSNGRIVLQLSADMRKSINTSAQNRSL